jgi:hypothetical protein
MDPRLVRGLAKQRHRGVVSTKGYLRGNFLSFCLLDKKCGWTSERAEAWKHKFLNPFYVYSSYLHFTFYL